MKVIDRDEEERMMGGDVLGGKDGVRIKRGRFYVGRIMF